MWFHRKIRFIEYNLISITEGQFTCLIFQFDVISNLNFGGKQPCCYSYGFLYPSFTRTAKIGPIFSVRLILPGSQTIFLYRNFTISLSDFVQFVSDCESKISNETL